MQKSGGGSRDFMMAAVPVAMLVMYAVVVGGGIGSSLDWIERLLRSLLDWAATLIS
jgi:hypothetical protein